MKLQYKVTLLTFVILAVIGSIGAMFLVFLNRQQHIGHFEESGLTVASALYKSLEDDMLLAQTEHIQDEITSFASQNYIKKVRILSPTGKVYASSKVSEVLQTMTDENIARAVITGEPITRTTNKYGQVEIDIILPVMNEAECQSCHGSTAKVLGIVEIVMDRTSVDAETKEQTLLLALIAGISFVIVGTALTLMLRTTVVNPLSRLANSVRRIAEGQFSTRIDVTGKDEVSTVAHTFNEMAEQIEQHALALEDAKVGLEQRVQERTTQVQQLAVARGRLLEKLVSAQEEERRRIARELHDDAGQALSALTMDLARAIEALPGEATESREKLHRSQSLVMKTLAELRKLIYDLRPEVLDELGLVPALRSYTKNRLEVRGIKTRLSFIGSNGRLPPEVEITLFRVIQEAITNIVRHSAASKVNIQVVTRNSTVTTSIVDNGKGFDIEAAFKAPESWGLRGIRERIAVVGGKLSIESEAGQGTSIKFQIPLGGV